MLAMLQLVGTRTLCVEDMHVYGEMYIYKNTFSLYTLFHINSSLTISTQHQNILLYLLSMYILATECCPLICMHACVLTAQ